MKKLSMTLVPRIVLLLACICITTSSAADVIFVENLPGESIEFHQVALGCEFYGLNVTRIVLNDEKTINSLLDSLLEARESICLIINVAGLNIGVHQDLLNQFQKTKKMHLFMMGITPQISSDILRLWTGDAIRSCDQHRHISGKSYFKFSNDRGIAFELAGQIFPVPENLNYGASVFTMVETSAVTSIIDFVAGNENNKMSIFVSRTIDDHKVFFQTATRSNQDHSCPKKWQFSRQKFLEIAPLMMFLKFTLGDRCWHSPADYANFTIDDPWLTEPYGFLSFPGLLKEMEHANFHTTIAFIPYNFDRSNLEVASLLKQHPHRFSICIHGNNHDHWEFYKYETSATDLRRAKSIALQEENIKQALARMETFQTKVSVNYDRVMVFPQGIAPQKTLALLKKYNFLATCNGGKHGNIPLDAEKPIDPIHQLRLIETQYENFPSMRRYIPEKAMPPKSQARIAIDLFLDNPLLLWAHHDFFSNGVDAFNKTAEVANQIQPDLQWKSLGEIAQHLYLERLRDDGNYDVNALSSNFIIKNNHDRPVRYFLQKKESFDPPIKVLMVNDHPYPYEKNDKKLSLTLDLAPGQSSHIAIEYGTGADWTNVETRNTDSHIARLRKLADFRDRTLSTFWLGQLAVRYYYQTGLFKLGLMRLAVIMMLLSLGWRGTSWQLRKRSEKKRN